MLVWDWTKKGGKDRSYSDIGAFTGAREADRLRDLLPTLLLEDNELRRLLEGVWFSCFDIVLGPSLAAGDCPKKEFNRNWACEQSVNSFELEFI